MAQSRAPIKPALDARVRIGCFPIGPGETTYTVDLDQTTVDELAIGVCSSLLQSIMYDLLQWRRDAIKALDVAE